MFSQQKKSTTPPLTLGMPAFGKGQKENNGKPLTAAQQYEQALVTASVFIEQSRARIEKEMEKYRSVAESNYWFYSYFGGTAVATMAASLALGSRVPFFRSYSGWIALGGGYFGGSAALGIHKQYLLAGVVKQVDHEIGETARMNEQTNNIVPDYQRESERLTMIKYELMPTLPEAVAARQNMKEQSIDDKVDSLLEAYEMRKKALQKK